MTSGPPVLAGIVEELERAGEVCEEPARINADRGNAERGLAQLVLTIVELLRQLMERQAIRRMESGSLSEDQVERMGDTFLELDRRMTELRDHFGLASEDLNLDLGPLGKLL